MEVNIEGHNLKALTAYIEAGCKSEGSKQMGLEVEHIIVHNDTLEAVTYYETNGIAWILESLKSDFPSHYYDGDDLLGLYNDEYAISIEPAGQFEISIAAKSEIKEIEIIYNRFQNLMQKILSPKNYTMLAIGYQPKSRVDSLPIIPKKRYDFMDAYFKKSGSMGRNMMRGTAAAQISIDYSSEEDFVKKYRAAYILMPAIKLLSDNTPVFEGKSYNGYIARTKIWDDVDPKRCGIMPGVFDDDFGFEAYAKYLYQLPPIFLPWPDGAIYTGDRTESELFRKTKLSEADIEHILSMVFLDVRAKFYIEIRGADSMPFPYVKAYLALIKGLLLNPDSLDRFVNQYKVNETDIKKAEESIAKAGYRGIIYGRKAGAFIREVLLLAKSGLDKEEEACLDRFFYMAEKELTMKEVGVIHLNAVREEQCKLACSEQCMAACKC